MKKFITIIVISLLYSFAFAQDTTKVLVPKNILTQEQIQTVNQSTTVEKIGQYIGLGKEIGTAVKEGLNATVDVAERASDTKPGIFTMWMIGYKVIGKDLARISIGLTIWLLFSSIAIISYFRTAMPRRILESKTIVPETKNLLFKSYNKNYKIINNDSDADVRKWSHVIMFVIVTIICSLIMFAS